MEEESYELDVHENIPKIPYHEAIKMFEGLSRYFEESPNFTSNDADLLMEIKGRLFSLKESKSNNQLKFDKFLEFSKN